jgi:hypothetical protein
MKERRRGMWHSDQYVFEQFVVRGKAYDPHIFEILELIPPTAEHTYWEINFKDGGKMVTTESVSLQFRERGIAELEEEKEFTNIRIG